MLYSQSQRIKGLLSKSIAINEKILAKYNEEVRQ